MNTNNYFENSYKVMSYCSLGISKINACKRYGTRYEASVNGNAIIDDAYDIALGYLLPGAGNCLAYKTAKRYGEVIRKKYYNTDNGDKVSALIEDAEENLKELFEEELRRNPMTYRMYDKSYYSDLFFVEEHDFHVDTGNEFWDTLSEILEIDRDYTLDNILEAIIEMETDVNKLAETFFETAHGIFVDYCRKIENLRV